MQLKDISFDNPAENIVYDEVLLHLAEKESAGEFLRFWESPQLFVVLGRICKEVEDLKMGNVQKDRIPVLRRASGGGTVLQGRGCLNYGLIVSKNREKAMADISQSYQILLQKITSALKKCDVNAAFWPISDLALKDSQKKFSGNAQKRGREFILHHGTILYDFDLSLIEAYLTLPKSIPDYREGRAHLDFVTNIPAKCQDIKDSIAEEFGARDSEVLSQHEKDLIDQFMTKRNVCVDI